MAAREEDVAAELEAVQAVYGDDCVVLDSYPPRIHLHIKPRTADVASQQFVEAVIEIRAGPQYPEKPPQIYLVDSKGLDEERQKHLTNYIREKASELSSCLMLVAVCEEAVEKLSVMNHPDGNCPLCLCPLVSEEEQSQVLPFMKLMSCFHCFHSECIIRWWSCIQKEAKINVSSTATTHSLRETRDRKDTQGAVEESMGNCPVCRKGFHVEDLEHVLHLVDNEFSRFSLDENEDDESQKFLQSDAEKARRENFDAILKLQQESGGLIEPKKNIAVVPGMFLTPPVAPSNPVVAKESPEEQHREPPVTPGMHSGGSSGRRNINEHRSSSSRKQREQRGRNRRQPSKQWIRKESDSAK
ncbi:PREDICTED: uncharacterized protein LOC101314503 [Fragaria vesca subsp. vesca]|uniref:uncharacterized protein LOC101314503 n=1 Tax=Fragaria vesca subsp. vesca TaxID=101020 RepID=UPI0002C36E01|nr:PREDICTED: uncharacterized protein LOC101314503 [Fragaria vesca subsp. vesca]